MANITHVDYESLLREAGQIRELGKNMNSTVLKIYDSVSNMRVSWFGFRYNQLVLSFNKMIPSLNEVLTLVVSTVPGTLEKVGDTYGRVDLGHSICTPNFEPAKAIPAISESREVGMRFKTVEVESVNANVLVEFEMFRDLLAQTQNRVNNLDWQSEAADAFRRRISELKNEIDNSMEQIKTQFARLMAETMEEIQAAETANTVQ